MELNTKNGYFRRVLYTVFSNSDTSIMYNSGMVRQRITLARNFLRDKNLVRKLVGMSSIGSGDFVYEIGAGSGIITNELVHAAKKVIAFEVDANLHNKLRERFAKNANVELLH